MTTPNTADVVAKMTDGPWHLIDIRASTLEADGWDGPMQDAILISALSPRELIEAKGENAIVARIELRNRPETLTESNFADARLIVAACNSYDRHFGERAVSAAEGDLLGRCLEALRKAAPIVEADLCTAKEYSDSDWTGQSQEALDAITAILSQAREVRS